MHHINRFSRRFGVVGLSLAIAVSATPLLSWFPPANPSAQALSVQELWQRSWQSVFGKRRPVPPVPPTGGGSRPVEGAVCAIAPLAVVESNSSILTPAIVWSDRPTFVWEGEAQKIGVRRRGSEDILWSQPVSGTNHVTYTGEPLQPDRVYEWLVLSSNNQVKRHTSFQVVTAQERKSISQALQQLDQQLTAEKITGETAALRRAEFFATQQIDNQPLWSEFWQEVLSVQTPSDQLTGWTRETITLLCKKPVNTAPNAASPSR
jgi:hypothetical protein